MTAEVLGEVSEVKASYMWQIYGHYLSYNAPRAGVESPIFKVHDLEWKLRLSTNDGADGLINDDFSVHLFLESSPLNSIETHYKLSLVDDQKKVIQSRSQKYTFSSSNKTSGFDDFIKKSDIASYTYKHEMRIICEIEEVAVDTSANNQPINDSSNYVHVGFEQYLNSEKFSDVKLNIGRKTLFAHKNILANKSDVFAAMFEHDMVENTSNIVEITDVDYDVMYEFLSFVYTGKVKESLPMIKRLIFVADKYAVQDLKGICENSLCKDLSLENVMDHLMLADTCNLDRLKAQCIDLIVGKSKKLKRNPKFKQAVRDVSPAVFWDIFSSISEEIEPPLDTQDCEDYWNGLR